MMGPLINDPDFVLYVGDVRDVLAGLPDESVHCVVTSPPYWGLRDYGTGGWNGGDPDHEHESVPARGGRGGSGAPGKQTEGAFPSVLAVEVCSCGARRVDRQLGLEATPDLYVENMVAVFREVRRVLRRDGTLWLNLGDSYNNRIGTKLSSHQRGLGFDSEDLQKSWVDLKAEGRTRMSIEDGMLKEKDLCGVPWRVAFALQADGWYLRADVIWSKPNPMPESVSDRPTKAHEYLFLLTRSPRYFYDADAVREPVQEWNTPNGRENAAGIESPRAVERERLGPLKGGRGWKVAYNNPAGRNRRSVWEIATEPYPDAHFATFPQALVEPCVKAGTSERGCCPECGAPWKRVVESRSLDRNELPRDHPEWRPARYDNGKAGDPQAPGPGQRFHESTTTGWRPTCFCGHERGPGGEFGGGGPRVPVSCTVLDPFMGSGTTALVARRLGRRSVGVELNETYAGLAARRLAQLSLLA